MPEYGDLFVDLKLIGVIISYFFLLFCFGLYFFYSFKVMSIELFYLFKTFSFMFTLRMKSSLSY